MSDAFTRDVSIHKFNLSPTGTVPVIVQNAEGQRSLKPAEWTLRVPGASPGAGGGQPRYSTFNARVEGLTESKLYR